MNRLIPLFEVVIFYALAQSVIWGSGRWRPPVLVVAVVMLLICVGSNYYHKDSMERIGLRSQKFWPNMKLVAPWLLLLIPFIYLGWGKSSLIGWDAWFAVLGYPFWGFAQEYVLLAFICNRLEDAMPGHLFIIPWVNGFLFSLAHLPNPVLMTITMMSGVVFTRIFLKERHLVPASLAHALFGVALTYAFGSICGIMSVGPAYLSRIGTPPLP